MTIHRHNRFACAGPCVQSAPCGFTLLEVLLASVIGSFVALAAIAALRTVISSRLAVEGVVTVSDELRYAMNLVRGDLENIYRDSSVENMKIVGTVDDIGGTVFSGLTLRAVSPQKARVEQPEGDLYEVEYHVILTADKPVLFRRACPIIGNEEDLLVAQRGVLTKISENIIGFTVRFFDGYGWVEQWNTQDGTLPELIEVTFTALPPVQVAKPQPVQRSFITGIAAAGQQTESDTTQLMTDQQSSAVPETGGM